MDLLFKHDKDEKYWTKKAIKLIKPFKKNNYGTHTCTHGSPCATPPGAPEWLCLIFVASAPAEDAFHKSIPILRLVAATGFPGTEDWEILFCALAPEVHGNTNLLR